MPVTPSTMPGFGVAERRRSVEPTTPGALGRPNCPLGCGPEQPARVPGGSRVAGMGTTQVTMLIFLRLLRSTIGLAILRFAWRRRALILRLLQRNAL